MKRQRQRTFVLLIFILMLFSVTTEVLLIFNITAKQAKEAGLSRLDAIRGDFETTVSSTQHSVLQLAVDVHPYLADEAELKAYIAERGEELYALTSGACRNVYIMTEDMYICSDSAHASDSSLSDKDEKYNGATNAAGSAFVSNPYYDIDAGGVCYSVSAALSDKKTVVGMDCTMDSVTRHIKEIALDGERDIFLVTNDGMIAGAVDDSLIGKDIVTEMPEYAGIFSLMKTSSEPVNSRQQDTNYFAVKSNYGVSLIVSEDNRTFYRTSLIPVVAMSAVTVLMFVFVIVMYLRGAKTESKAREDLEYREKFLRKSISNLNDPLAKIRNSSSAENIKHSTNYEQEFDSIRAASDTLSEQIKEIIAYSDLIRSEHETQLQKEEEEAREIKSSRTFRTVIYLSLSAVLVLCVYINYAAASNYGKSRMKTQALEYQTALSDWIYTQKCILDTYGNAISADPSIVENYDEAIKLLDGITKKYPEVSASYIANPELSPTIYMNSGWKPSEGWRVEDREWYKQTVGAKEDWSISPPYCDIQTGYYCVTFSKELYSSDTGEFIGVFAIDFYMDKLVEILGGSYSDTGYAFLTDEDGRILNHPYGSYQMTENSSRNVFELPYHMASPYTGDVAFFSDYDGELKAAVSMFNEMSHLSLYVVSDLQTAYGDILIFSFLSIAALVFCMVLVYRLITSLIKLQERTNKSLREAADSAIAADEAKSKFLAQMSHEIRTPINAVIGMNEMILRESADNTIREYAVNIQSAGRTLLSLINSILDFSKIEDGKMEIIPVKYDTASMIHDLVSSITPRAKSKGLELIVRTDATLPSALKGDDVRIKQVVSNLLTNAVKYTEKGSVKLIFKRENQHDDTIDLYVEVTDTGIGIKEEDLGALFDSFKRLEEKRNRNIEGTGLGMSIVTKLLGMMDSKLEVHSEYGKGSTFCFRVRQRIASPVAMGDYQSRIMKPDELDDDMRHLYAPRAQVLVVDDNEMNIKVAVSMLKVYGIVPDTAGSGHDAIELCKEKKYHIIFMDHMMPILDGIETLKLLKEQQLIDDHTSVIALTANAIVGAKEMYLGEGFNDYLTKPIESRKFEKLIEKYLPERLVTHRKLEPPTIKEEKHDADSFTMTELKELHEKCPAIDVMTGLGYCMDSKEFFLDTLDGYLQTDKRLELSQAFESGDIKNYGILAHSLKSTSKTVGALVLSEHAKELEFAAKRGDEAYIKEHHESVMTEYAAVLDGVREVLKK